MDKIYNNLNHHEWFQLNFKNFIEYNLKHMKVMNQIKGEISNEPIPFSSESRKQFLNHTFKQFFGNKSLDDHLYYWGFDKNIDLEFMYKIVDTSKHIRMDRNTVINIGIENTENNIIINEINNSSFNELKKEVLLSKIIEKIDHNILKEIFSVEWDINQDFFIYISIINKICFNLSPLIGLSCLVYYSENINEFRDFKKLIVNRINKIEIFNYNKLNVFNKTTLFLKKYSNIITISSISCVSVGLFINNRNKNNNNFLKNVHIFLRNYSRESGKILGIITANFYDSFRKETYSIIKPLIEDCVKKIKNIKYSS